VRATNVFPIFGGEALETMSAGQKYQKKCNYFKISGLAMPGGRFLKLDFAFTK